MCIDLIASIWFSVGWVEATGRNPSKPSRRAFGRAPERWVTLCSTHPTFMFQLSQDEKTEVVANCDHLGKLYCGGAA